MHKVGTSTAKKSTNDFRSTIRASLKNSWRNWRKCSKWTLTFRKRSLKSKCRFCEDRRSICPKRWGKSTWRFIAFAFEASGNAISINIINRTSIACPGKSVNLRERKSPAQLVQMTPITINKSPATSIGGRIRTATQHFTQKFQLTRPVFSWC